MLKSSQKPESVQVKFPEPSVSEGIISMLVPKTKDWFRLAENLDWSSYDPFDILLSPYLSAVRLHSPFLARVCIKIGKSFGDSIRKSLAIHPHVESKTLSDFMSAAVTLSLCGQDWAVLFIERLTTQLHNKAIQTSCGLGWGLEFPYVSRFVNVPSRTPNVYQTLNAVDALLDVYDFTKSPFISELCKKGMSHTINELGFFFYSELKWLRYWPCIDAPIVNVQALGAGVFARAGFIFQDISYYQIANQLLHTVSRAQRRDGSWLYSLDGKANFIDGFHTGYILQGLRKFVDFVRIESTEKQNALAALAAGFHYFKEHFFTDEGSPRLYSSGKPSSDGQNISQCIQTLMLCSDSLRDWAMACQLWEKMISLPQFQFYNIHEKERAPLYRSSSPQLRWSIGPATLATSILIKKLNP